MLHTILFPLQTFKNFKRTHLITPFSHLLPLFYNECNCIFIMYNYLKICSYILLYYGYREDYSVYC